MEGVPDATTYEYHMKMRRYGPDILAEVKTNDLVEIGIPPGAVLWLKHAAPIWWTSADAKHQCTAGNGSGWGEGFGDLAEQLLISFEKQFKDDFDWFFYLNAAKAMVPIPLGFMPVIATDI